MPPRARHRRLAARTADRRPLGAAGRTSRRAAAAGLAPVGAGVDAACSTPTGWSNGATKTSTNRSTASPRWSPTPSTCPSKPRSNAMLSRLAPESGYDDDVAIVLYRQTHSPLLIEYDATPHRLSDVRHRLAAWLRANACSGDDRRRHRAGRQRGLHRTASSTRTAGSDPGRMRVEAEMGGGLGADPRHRFRFLEDAARRPRDPRPGFVADPDGKQRRRARRHSRGHHYRNDLSPSGIEGLTRRVGDDHHGRWSAPGPAWVRVIAGSL